MIVATVAPPACRAMIAGLALLLGATAAVAAPRLDPPKRTSSKPSSKSSPTKPKPRKSVPPAPETGGAPAIASPSPEPAPPALRWPRTGYWSTRGRLLAPDRDAPPALVATVPAPAEQLPPPPAPGGTPPSSAGPNPFPAGGDCLAALRASGATFAEAAQPGSNPLCAIDTPVQLSALPRQGTGGAAISLPDRPTIACRLALRFGEWTRASAPVLAAQRNAPLVAMATGPGWECRSRNRQPDAKMSAHANGLALDVGTFVFADKSTLVVAGSDADPVVRTIRDAACTWFTTVLGPGSDAFHADHLHLDILRRGPDGETRYCH